MTTESVDHLLDNIIRGNKKLGIKIHVTEEDREAEEWTSSSISLTTVSCILALILAAAILVILLHQKYNKTQRTESEQDFFRRLRRWVKKTESQPLWNYGCGSGTYPDESHYTRVDKNSSQSQELLRPREIPARVCKSTPDASKPCLNVTDRLTYRNSNVCTVDASTSTVDYEDEEIYPLKVLTTSLELLEHDDYNVTRRDNGTAASDTDAADKVKAFN